MPKPTPEMQLRTSPHVHVPRSVSMIMRHVVYAMLPLCAWGTWIFGISALVMIATATAAAVLAEHLFCKLANRPTTVGDYSVVITGMLLGLTLPPGFPLWMTVVGAFVSVGLGKMLFGGLGFNVFNPALVGRAFLQAAFPVAITSYGPPMLPDRFTSFVPTTLTPPFLQPPVDALSGATPLMLQKFDRVGTDLQTLFLGYEAGSAGETSALLVMLSAVYLSLRKFMDWRIPVGTLGGAALLGAIFWYADPSKYPNPLVTMFSGGLMLGAVFMASDMVGSPVTPLGIWIYGGTMGALTVIIRFLGGLPEGVMYAILLGNAVSPLIDNLTQPRVYGVQRKKAAA